MNLPEQTADCPSASADRAMAVSVFRSRPMVGLYFCFAAAAVYLLVTGERAEVAGDLLQAAWILLSVLLTERLLKAAPAPPDCRPAPSVPRKILFTQLALIGVFIALTYPRQHDFLVGKVLSMPWPPFLAALLQQHVKGLDAIIQCLLLFAVPYTVLRLLGGKSAALGLGKGYRVWATILIWNLVPVGVIGWSLLTHHTTPGDVFKGILINAYANGFFEEFLFRGALLTRLEAVWGLNSAIVVSSLAFGLWHINLNANLFHGDLSKAIASSILAQTAFGIGLAYLSIRSRNLVSCSITHVLFNVANF